MDPRRARICGVRVWLLCGARHRQIIPQAIQPLAPRSNSSVDLGASKRALLKHQTVRIFFCLAELFNDYGPQLALQIVTPESCPCLCLKLCLSSSWVGLHLPSLYVLLILWTNLASMLEYYRLAMNCAVVGCQGATLFLGN